METKIHKLFSALSDPTRLAIVERIAKEGPQSAKALCEPFNMSVPAVSQHLKVLRDCELVCVEKQAQKRIYHLNETSIEALESWKLTLGNLASSSQDLETPKENAPEAGALGAFLRARATKAD